MVLTTIMTRRKSPAAGWRRAMMVLQSSSMPTSMALTLWSLATIVAAQLQVTRGERIHRQADLLLDEAAHLQHARAQRFELGVELLGRMVCS